MKTILSWLSAMVTYWKGMTKNEADEAEDAEECNQDRSLKIWKTTYPDGHNENGWDLGDYIHLRKH